MKKVMLTILILTLAAISQAELLTDAGFEEGAWPVTGNWGYYNWVNSETDPAVARTGSGYLANAYSLAWEWIPGEAGETYTLSAWFKDAYGGIGTAGTVDTILKLEWRDIAGNIGDVVALPADISKDWTAGPGGDGWQQKTVTATAPAGTVTVVATLGQYGGDASMWIDDASLTSDNPKAVAPDPTVGDTVGHLFQTDLSWRHGSNTATFDVYLRADTEPNNIVAGDVIASGISAQTVPVSLVNNTDYVWRVDSTDGATTTGEAWSFATGDVPPAADAGEDQYLWGAPLTGINLDGAIIDEGNSAVSYVWDLTQGISGFVTINNDTSLNATADITQKGEYIFRLTATDAAGSDSDTVLVSITDDACTAALADPTDYTTPFAGDLSGDCVVGIDDLKLLALDWLGCIGCTP
jgi:hypothetical protein